MKRGRVENLVSLLWTGAFLIAVALFFLVRGWFLTQLGMPPLAHRGGVLEPPFAVLGGVTLLVIGVGVVAVAVIAKLRGGPQC